MPEFWESAFRGKQEMWGHEPSGSAVSAASLFQEKGLKDVLVPGFGYGRNARVFTDNGFRVTGIEISETALELAEKQFGDQVTLHHGSVSDMPFDQELYGGIYCYALIHLLGEAERAKLIRDCYRQLRPGGYMVFVAISTNTGTYGEGTQLGKDLFETPHGVRLFYYDLASVEREFGDFGLLEAQEIEESTMERPVQKFWRVICGKR